MTTIYSPRQWGNVIKIAMNQTKLRGEEEI